MPQMIPSFVGAIKVCDKAALESKNLNEKQEQLLLQKESR